MELRSPSPVVCAYIAGYFDAEAWIGVRATNGGSSWTVAVVFCQTQPEVVRWLHTLYGGSLRPRPPPRKYPHWRPQTAYTLSRYGVIVCLLADILPYLREKKDQAQAVLDRFASHMSPHDGARLCADLASMRERTVVVTPPRLKAKTRTHWRCSIAGCVQRGRARGLCFKHYYRARTAGTLPPLAVRPRREASELERAYFAGYFDGDGCVRLDFDRDRWRVAIAFGQTRGEGLYALHEVYGGSLARYARRGNRRPVLYWHLSARADTERFLRDVAPYAIEKREQVQRALVAFREPLTLEAGRVLRLELSRLKQR